MGLYAYAFNHNKWPMASQMVECPASDTSLFEGESLPRQPFLKVRHGMERDNQKCNRFMGDSGGKLDPELEHPPPSCAECS
ncbi:MAG: hypothetical protein K0R76_1000 [Alphaproteobacteria bacterium]|nr:hypothetical protein [Alphaproteobacteria bacterium]